METNNRSSIMKKQVLAYRLEEAEESCRALTEKERYCKDMLQELRYNPHLNGEKKQEEDGYFVRSGTCYVKLKRHEIERLVRTNYQEVSRVKSEITEGIADIKAQLKDL